MNINYHASSFVKKACSIMVTICGLCG